ncbi:hypothetical protein, unlikely [Trypanosoma brucei gambiense DAL972]|uniref:Uncharacterized protein n=1 Tax=Trypanosoma brucei gambiense (strain MHOM/CI/86/DAL972) TaxID=679716 RepID=D0A081_TRYB9|nr:hypothetical protein, unlikely [Trypanosoma brucei gambiense DAL972]CBH16639.1 hypothetical protein, unlikely [Trypanosoma brucei gambiense DAL972]|eukprot:XP_011778903.1 hypothetical protein, unlikely [Trypanosoma brucei gambiense DAL972]
MMRDYLHLHNTYGARAINDFLFPPFPFLRFKLAHTHTRTHTYIRVYIYIYIYICNYLHSADTPHTIRLPPPKRSYTKQYQYTSASKRNETRNRVENTTVYFEI